MMSVPQGRWPSDYAQRSSGAHRGRRSGRSWRRRQPITRAPSPPIGDMLSIINEHDLAGSTGDENFSPTINGSRYVSSYNWLNTADPTILIPGKPPAWTPLASAVKLQEDDGQYFRDQNATRYPPHPVQPAVEALLFRRPDFPVAKLDIVACSSTMENLLRFVRKIYNPFRTLVEVVGSTVFFVRRENSPAEVFQEVYGYGFRFPEVYTTWEPEVEGSASHQRFMHYNFAGLNCLVLFEADGYLPHLQSTGVETTANNTVQRQDISSGPTPEVLQTHTTATNGLKFQDMSGEAVPQDAIFDLKTRSIKKKDKEDTLSEGLPRLWIAQIPNFILAYHTRGVFEDIRVKDVRDDVQEWEQQNQASLRHFGNLLRRLVAFAHTRQIGRFELRLAEGSTALELREQCEGAGRALSANLVARWTSELEDYGI